VPSPIGIQNAELGPTILGKREGETTEPRRGEENAEVFGRARRPARDGDGDGGLRLFSVPQGGGVRVNRPSSSVPYRMSPMCPVCTSAVSGVTGVPGALRAAAKPRNRSPFAAPRHAAHPPNPPWRISSPLAAWRFSPSPPPAPPKAVPSHAVARDHQNNQLTSTTTAVMLSLPPRALASCTKRSTAKCPPCAIMPGISSGRR